MHEGLRLLLFWSRLRAQVQRQNQPNSGGTAFAVILVAAASTSTNAESTCIAELCLSAWTKCRRDCICCCSGRGCEYKYKCRINLYCLGKMHEGLLLLLFWSRLRAQVEMQNQPVLRKYACLLGQNAGGTAFAVILVTAASTSTNAESTCIAEADDRSSWYFLCSYITTWGSPLIIKKFRAADYGLAKDDHVAIPVVTEGTT
eukprot:gene25784-1734_t